MTQEQFLERQPPNLFDETHIKTWFNRFDKRFVEDILFDYILDEFNRTKNNYSLITDDRGERVNNLYKSWNREEKLNQLGL